MNIIEINKQTLYNLYEQFPESFSGLKLEGNNLVYKGEAVDISNFNINDLLTPETDFYSSLSVLSSEDIFKIIRLHAIKLDSLMQRDEKSKSEKRVEIIKSENPLMKNISIVVRNNNGLSDEFLNIVDSTGRDHLFRNDRDVDIFDIYESLKYRNIGHDITPDELVDAINRKLYQVQLKDARTIMDSSTVSEQFANKIDLVNRPYKDDKMHTVYGNEDNDIAIVADNAGGEHKVVTFDHNQYGDLVMQNHGQNVAGSDTSLVNNGTAQDVEFESNVNSNTEFEVQQETNDEIMARLITPEEFYRLISSSEDLSEKQRKDVDLYYAYIEI